MRRAGQKLSDSSGPDFHIRCIYMEYEEKKPPFFIIGCPRSGTTVFQLLLDSHPLIAVPPESHFFLSYRRLLDNPAFDLTSSRHFDLFLRMVEKDWRIRNWKLDSPLAEIYSNVPRSPAHFIDMLFSAYARQEGKVHWGDKTPQHAQCLETILAVFPQARIIHLVRDGRDVAESLARVHIGPQSITGRARRWRHYINRVEQVRSHISPSRFKAVRFEDLVMRTEETMAAVFRFLEEEPADRGRNIASRDSAAGRQYRTSSPLHSSAARPLSGDKIGVYKKNMTEREKEIFESIAGRELRANGYTTAARDERCSITVREKISFAAEDTLWRYLRKIFSPDNYGLAAKQVYDRLQHSVRMLQISRVL